MGRRAGNKQRGTNGSTLLVVTASDGHKGEVNPMVDLPRLERHMLFLRSVRALVEEATSAVDAAPLTSDESSFFSGVRRAGEDLLHADELGIRPPDLGWLDHETPSFRDGYLLAEARLAAAIRAAEPPARIAPPAFRGATAR